MLSDENGNRHELTAFNQFSFDWDEDGQIEPVDGEYTVLDFPMSEASLLHNLKNDRRHLPKSFRKRSPPGPQFTLLYGDA